MDFVRVGFIDPYPIDKDTQPLRAATERRDTKTPVAQVHLRGIALLVAELRAWEEVLQHGLQRCEA